MAEGNLDTSISPVLKIVMRGDCVQQVKLLDHNCEGCPYFEKCTNKRKRKEKPKKNKKRK